jgi:hypothetical protein
MNISLRPFLVAVLVGLPLLTTPALAKKKGGKGAPAAKATSSDPAQALAPYVENIDAILALDAPRKGGTPLRSSAPTRLAVLKQEFIAQRASAAPADAPKLDAAVGTCNAIISAIDERERTASSIQASASVSGGGKLNAPSRKDALNQGVRGRDLAKAVGEIEEGKRARAEAKAGRQTTAQTDAALTAMSVNRWNHRAVELRNQIVASYTRVTAPPAKN